MPAFEQAVAANVGARHGVAVNSATSALPIACLARGLGPGVRLWTSPITFVASANCGRYCGAAVDFVDIDPTTALMNVAAFGALAERYGFALLEEASHAVGGRYQGEPEGNCRHSAVTVFSFHPVKIITAGEGGLATTNNPLLAQRMAELRSHGATESRARPSVLSDQQLGPGCRSSSNWATTTGSQTSRRRWA